MKSKILAIGCAGLITILSMQIIQTKNDPVVEAENDRMYKAIPLIGQASVSDNALRVLKDALNNGANPNAQRNNKTALMFAMDEFKGGREGFTPIELLADSKFNKDIDFIADNGMTALTYAAADGKADFIRIVLSAGADPYKLDGYGMTMQNYLDENARYIPANSNESREVQRKKYNEFKKMRDERLNNYLQKQLEEEMKKELEDWEIIEQKG